ncbi:MAG: LCP family protein [Oscillochloridaceae bacterium umkhey_bin13]
MVSAIIAVSLIFTVITLRLAFEWRQALADIDAMIVTPIDLDLELLGEPAAEPATEPATNIVVSHTSPVHDELFGPPSAPVVEGEQVEAPVAAVPDEPIPTLSQPTLNVLLLGTDARPQDTEPTRTDALVLVRIERESGRVSMLSIPRDLWVNYPSGGEGRINAAYALGERRFGPGGGAALAKSTVGGLLGLKVDHFVLINFQGFEALIDLLGGITVDVPEPLYDPAYPTEDYGTMEVRFEAGPQRLNAERALIYARTRHADSDFGRNQRQQQVLMAIFERIRDRGLLQQLTSLDNYTGAMRDYVKTDLNRKRMLELAGFARGINADQIVRYAIDSHAIVDLRSPATFAAEPAALNRIVRQFTGEAVSTAGGQ